MGYKTGEELHQEIRHSLLTVLPSEWYENNPRSILEGFALGRPAIGARIGGIPELVIEGETGLTFESGNALDLRSKIQGLLSNPKQIEAMGRKARNLAEREWSTEQHYQKLMEIYATAANSRQSRNG